LSKCIGEDAQAESGNHRDHRTFRWVKYPTVLLGHFQQRWASPRRRRDRGVSLGESKNILRRRNCFQLFSSPPTDDDIEELIDAAAGLFVRPVAVLRHVGYPSDWQFHEILQFVLVSREINQLFPPRCS